MQKEELFALLDQLLIDQDKFNKFREYLFTFVRAPRCKKGCVEFAKEIFGTENVAGLKELSITMLSEKSYQNSNNLENFINQHPITNGYNDALINARMEIMQKVADYIKDMYTRLDTCDLVDRYERHICLRRAVSRLASLFVTNTPVTVTAEQWPEVEVKLWLDYVTTTLDELVGRINQQTELKEWSDVYGSYYHLDRPEVIGSLRNFLDYLDSFLEY